MTKPWEESWVSDRGDSSVLSTDGKMVADVWDNDYCQLIAQAPAMARLLIEIMQNDYLIDGHPVGYGIDIADLLKEVGVEL